MTKQIAFITYETPYARCGGIAAVMARLPGHLQEAAGLPVVVITPFHHRIASTSILKPCLQHTGTVYVDGTPVKILRYEEWGQLDRLPRPGTFLNYLRDPTSPLAAYLRGQLPGDISRRLNQYKPGRESTSELTRAVTAQLNRLLLGPCFYTNGMFTGIPLPGWLRQALAQPAGERNAKLLNYALLQAAYPDCIPPFNQWPWYFLAPGPPTAAAWFGGFPHPYALHPDQAENTRSLLHDALFFGKAVAAALPVIACKAEWILLMQDWEAATTSLALNDDTCRYRQFLVLHNSYDTSLETAPASRPAAAKEETPSATLLNLVIPKVERPIFTVSEQFARDMTRDFFQVRIMASHLQDSLQRDFIGVDNGPFETLQLDREILQDSFLGSFHRLEQWKKNNRESALTAIRCLRHSSETPVWGSPGLWEQQVETCWFVMAGRDDPRQKGYDLAAAAARVVLQQERNACFLFFPIPGDTGLAGLSFLKELSTDFPDRVLVLPFHWQEGYFAALRGAAFGLMPSLYEPFGSANEFYLNGTAGIGRATGGLLQQIIPLRAAASFSQAVQRRSKRWQSPAASPTGLLFREQDDIPSAGHDWEKINSLTHQDDQSQKDRIRLRLNLTTYKLMVEELKLCLQDAVHIYRNNPELYHRMIRDGIIHIQNSFSWKRAAYTYVRHILKSSA